MATWRALVVAALAGLVLIMLIAGCGSDAEETVPNTGSPQGSGSEEAEPTPLQAADQDSDDASQALPASDPDTAGGATEWEVTYLGGYITYPAAYEGGYVALLDGQVATSADGLAWVVMEHQPFGVVPASDSQRRLVLSEEGPIAVAAASGAPVQAALLRDGVWEDIPIEGDGPDSGGSLVEVGLGPDGVVLWQGLGEFWAFDGDVFRFVPELGEMTWFGGWNQVGWVRDIEPPPTLSADRPGMEFVRGAAESNGRIVALGWPEDDAPAWTTDNRGATWEALSELQSDWKPINCGMSPTPPRLTGEVIEAGPLGWLAAGSMCARPVWWFSPDGTAWEELDETPNVAPWDIMLPFPPSILMEEDRIVVYGNNSVSVHTP